MNGQLSSTARFFLILGAVNAVLVIALGAFGAHWVKQRISIESLVIYQTAVQYHFYHVFGLFIVGLTAIQIPVSSYLKWSGGLMLTGLIFFSGSLYVLSLTDLRWLGALTPIGGVMLIVSWVMFIIAMVKS